MFKSRTHMVIGAVAFHYHYLWLVDLLFIGFYLARHKSLCVWVTFQGLYFDTARRNDKRKENNIPFNSLLRLFFSFSHHVTLRGRCRKTLFKISHTQVDVMFSNQQSKMKEKRERWQILEAAFGFINYQNDKLLKWNDCETHRVRVKS